MRAFILLVVLAVSFPARGQCPPTPPQGEVHIVLEKGDLSPVRGVLAPEALARYDYLRLSCAEQARDACYRNFDEKAPPVLKPLMWGGIAGFLVGAIIVGLVKR